MDQAQYRQARESGDLVVDAALQEDTLQQEEPEIEQEVEVTETAEPTETTELPEDTEDDLPLLSEKEKTAFEKRLERERKKDRERIEQEYEQKYGRYKQVVDVLGGDPDAIEKQIKETQVVREAQRMAEANGWSDEDTRWYIEEQKRNNELKELRVQMNINRLRDNPDFAGIASMEKEIMSKIDKTNGALTVEEAYWAIGGPRKAEQLRLEAQMRESVKRQTTPRVVLTDSQTATTAEKPLPADVLRDAERMGISAAEARRLMSKKQSNNIDEWRANRAK